MNIYSKNGYTLLFAVLTATLVLGVAVFILSVSKKQFALAVAARDSMYSIYAADSGIECASAATIATSTDGTITSPATLSIDCNGATFRKSNNNVTPTDVVFSGPISDPLFKPNTMYKASGLVMSLDATNKTCAVITVRDGIYTESGVDKHMTIIDSSGYNYCNPTAGIAGSDPSIPYGPKTSSRTVERALRLTYTE